MAREELETLNTQAGRLKDRMELVWEDYIYVLEYMAVYRNADISGTISDIEERIAEHEVKII